RDDLVTGVQTCALPICPVQEFRFPFGRSQSVLLPCHPRRAKHLPEVAVDITRRQIGSNSDGITRRIRRRRRRLKGVIDYARSQKIGRASCRERAKESWE